MKKYTLLLIVFFIPFLVQADCYEVTGAGSSAANQIYVDLGNMADGLPKYEGMGWDISHSTFAGLPYWGIYLTGVGNAYFSQTANTTPDGLTYQLNVNGNNPPPSVALVTCPSVIADDAFFDPTNVTQATNGDIVFGIAIIITMLSLMLVGFTWNTISSKKKQTWER